MIYRCILPSWASELDNSKPRVLEGEFDEDKIARLNESFYNVYFLPNYPSLYDSSKPVDGSDIDTFRYVFVDMDLKDGAYTSKEEFIQVLKAFQLVPTLIVDSGNGIHAYWEIKDLDAKSFLKLQRRLMRKFRTDEAVAKIYQLMRTPGTINTKYQDGFKLCSAVDSSENTYTCETLDTVLPQLTREDEAYCEQHYNKTYRIDKKNLEIDDKLPLRFAQLLENSAEVKELWVGETDDRSKSDFRLGHLMFAHGFSKSEATSVLVNTVKAMERAPIHRLAYATGIVDKIWTYEITADKNSLNLSSTVKDILNKYGDNIKGSRFPCWKYIDATHHGFRLGQVIGLVAGSGVGKTAICLNMFQGFAQNNPDYDHFFVPLEQPVNEIAERWKIMCGEDTRLHERVHLISNYNEDGSFRHLSLEEIKTYILKFQEVTKRKVGCVVIDHIGALKMKGKEGENQGLIDICHSMKAFAVQTNTLLVMQSQAPRDKAGIGDLELNKDAAYGTMYFEAYCDYLITVWQPLKRCYTNPKCPTVTSFKFCKIRHKKQGLDSIQEDARYNLYFDSKHEKLREMTQDEEISFKFFNNEATNKRKEDRKTDVLSYNSITWTKGEHGNAEANKDVTRT